MRDTQNEDVIRRPCGAQRQVPFLASYPTRALRCGSATPISSMDSVPFICSPDSTSLPGRDRLGRQENF